MLNSHLSKEENKKKKASLAPSSIDMVQNITVKGAPGGQNVFGSEFLGKVEIKKTQQTTTSVFN